MHYSNKKSPPRTLEEAQKLGWMAGKGYGNAKKTLLAARDQYGFLMVVDEEDDHEIVSLLSVSDQGDVLDASVRFSSLSYEQVQEILRRYPQVEGSHYLAEVIEREKQEADERRRRITLSSKNGSHTILLCIWSKNAIDVSIDKQIQGSYRFRELMPEEQLNPRWKTVTALLEPDIDDPVTRPGAPYIGLTLERRQLIEQKIQELATKNEE